MIGKTEQRAFFRGRRFQLGLLCRIDLFMGQRPPSHQDLRIWFPAFERSRRPSRADQVSERIAAQVRSETAELAPADVPHDLPVCGNAERRTAASADTDAP